jgi:SAM-dependent methyltransferase
LTIRPWSLKYLNSLKQAVKKVKYTIIRIYLQFPIVVECNICAWKGRRFISDEWHLYAICPNCLLDVRHRLIVAALTYINGLSWMDIVHKKRVLHFAPEDNIEYTLQKYAATYVTADLFRSNTDLTLDISDMKSVSASEYDLIIACDVLEHVSHDIKAMQEIYRILSPGGFAILTVPQKDNLEETFEDPTAVTPEERERLFGLPEHLRIYGNDFTKLLESVGFKVTIVNVHNFTDELVRKHILFPPILSLRPFATNYRNVFFAHKSFDI